MSALEEVAELFREVDRSPMFQERVATLIRWLESLPGVRSACLVCRDRLSLGSADGLVARMPAAVAGALPPDIAVLNGKSPVPHHLLPDSANGSVTVFSPFSDRGGEFAGALLIRADSPAQFVRRFRPQMRLLSSKARDLVEIAAARSETADGRVAAAPDELSPRLVGRLLDLLRLPAYVLSLDGTFVHVNACFLEQFDYADLEDVNSRGDVFVREDDWAAELRRLTAERAVTPLAVRIRTGTDHVRTVQDYSVLTGRTILGVLVDVSEYVRVNERLQDALEGQTRLNEQLSSATSMLQKTQAIAMKTLANLAEYRDKETGGHLQRICEYMKLLAIELHRRQPYSFQIGPDYAEDIYLSGMLHDIGKVRVPDHILLKEGPLEASEWNVMKQHTTWGYALLSKADDELGQQSYLTLASRIALHHHEWYNGDGYPHGLQGESIPLSARIGAVSDVYDALTSRRPYKEAWSHERAINEIRQLREKQFDPVIVEVLLDQQDRFPSVRSRFPDELPVAV